MAITNSVTETSDVNLMTTYYWKTDVKYVFYHKISNHYCNLVIKSN